MSTPAVQPRYRFPRLAQEAVDRARLSVVPRMRSRAPKVPFVTLVSLVLVGGVVGLLLFNTSMQQASFAAASLEAQAESLSAREQTLRLELDQLRDPQRVASAAQGMGMVIPAAPVFLDLDGGAVTGERTPTTRENALRLAPKAAIKPAVLAPPPTIVEVPATEVPDTSAQAAPQPEKQTRGKTRKTKNKSRR